MSILVPYACMNKKFKRKEKNVSRPFFCDDRTSFLLDHSDSVVLNNIND